MSSANGMLDELASSTFERVAIGSIAKQYVVPKPVKAAELYTNLGVKWYGEGVFARESKLGREIKGTTLFGVKPGQFIYNRMFVTEGAFGLVGEEFAKGVVSNEFPVYDLDTKRVVPEWLLLKFQEPATVGAAAAQAMGGTKSRRRWKEEQFEAFEIALPPIEMQREIVSILSRFSELADSLRAEIDARRLQYSHYSNLLLNFDESECEWLTLREVAVDFGRGKSKHRPRNDPKLYGGHYPFIQTGDVRSSGHLIRAYSQTYNEHGLAQSKLWPKGTVCITIAANIAETGILNFEACFPDSVIGFVANPNRTSPYYVEYLLKSFKEKLAAKGHGTAQANINLGTFEHEKLPFPSRKEQDRIVSALDKFDALANDGIVGIPAELDARRNQYAYYRSRFMNSLGAVS